MSTIAAVVTAPARQSRRGFTIVEMMVVISIITLLVAMLMPSFRMARERARASNCLGQMRQIGVAQESYGDDHKQIMMPLEINGTSPPGAVIPWGGLIRWPDLLRDYCYDPNVYDCVSATKSIWGPGKYGIGLNHIELSYSPWTKKNISRFSVRRPGKAVLLADVGQVSNYAELADPDQWIEIPGRQLIYFLTPNHSHFFSASAGPGLQQRVVPRHLATANAIFADTHGETISVSSMNFQAFPGVAPGGGQAKGDNVIGGGNDQWDPTWLWGRQ